MAITVNTTDTFEQWRVKTNQLGSDVDSNIAAVRADITSNVATINANIASPTGNIVTGNLTINQNVFGNAIKISSNNVMIGGLAGNVNAGNNNTFLGSNAGLCNTNGCQNTFVGSVAGCKNCSGENNTFTGNSAGRNNTSGCNNSFFGSNAGVFNTTDGCNTFIGASAGRNNDGGFNNSFLGAFSGCSNTGGDLNTFAGVFSGVNNTLGSCNTFFGTESGCSNTSGCNNTFIGYRAGCAVTTGVNNTIIGNVAGSAALSNTVIIAAGSNVRAYIDSTGNVGIGTSSSTPLSQLDISNSASFDPTQSFYRATTNSGAGVGRINWDGNNSSAARVTYARIQAEITGTTAGSHTGNLNFYTSTAGTLTEKMRINSSGNVGIGTTGATGPLSVKTDTDFVIAMRTTSASNGARVVALNLAENAYKDLVVDGANVQIATGGNERVRIDSAGNMGIGTSSPQRQLEVYTAAGGTSVQVRSSAVTTDFGVVSTNDAALLYTRTNHPIVVGTNDVERVRIDSSGICVGGNVKFGSSTTTNTFLGFNAGCSNTTGCQNLFVGFCAGVCNTCGSRNTFIGTCSGFDMTFGTDNSFLGFDAGKYNTGSSNSFFGSFAGACMFGSSGNTFIGRNAGRHHRGASNTFLGHLAGEGSVFPALNSGNFNVFLGSCAGVRVTSGNYNTGAGPRAGCNVTSGANNIFIGRDSGECLACTTTESNRIVMGNNTHTLACIQIAWSVASDVRDKCIYGPVPFGKTFLRQINPITYSFKNRETNEITDDRKRYGFCAQEISALEGGEDIIVNTDDPNKLGMSHEYLIPILVNAVKELADDLDELRAEIQQLKSN